MSTPNFTTAQLVGAVFAAFYPALTLLGIDLSAEQKDAVDQLWAVGLGLFGADAAIRVGRSVGLPGKTQ